MGGVANTIVESVNNGKQAACYMHQYLQVYVTGSGKRYVVAHIFKIELLAPWG